jgi:hypothetical protein
MKATLLFLLCLLCTTAAFGQAAAASSGLSAQPVIYEFYSHPEHAAQTPMGREQNLLESSCYVSAKGERPLWEFAAAQETPLGDVARVLRKEHEMARKAHYFWNN